LKIINLKTLDKEGVHRFIECLHLPRYRADQLLLRLYRKHAVDIEEITEFSKELRTVLKTVAYISNLKLVNQVTSSDNTDKFLFALEDGQTVESVLISDKERLTLCISSQVGCAMGCLFCQTARCGFVRNLKSYEIIDQIIAVNRVIHPKRVTNVVLMGMGEPLANFDWVVDALWKIVELLGISKRKITLSTAGLVPKLLMLPRKAPDINLAISLNATTDEVRNRIMPVNRRYPIQKLLDACGRYPLHPGRRITFEYVMIDGLNDFSEDARRLVKLLSGIRCKINLIPLNPFLGCELKRSPDERVHTFQKILLQHKTRALIRESRGRDICAACGQLRANRSNLQTVNERSV
jgi:23S rRNA (adenine2503-C2)-methyltransferase